MDDLLITAYVAYFRMHPEDREGLKFLEVDPAIGPMACLTEDVGKRWVAWLRTDPAWTSRPIARRLSRQMQRLDQATPAAQCRFQTALRHAIAQLDFGEDR